MSDFPAIAFTNYAGLVECFAQAKNHRNVPNLQSEQMFGLSPGHIEKILNHKKNLGPLTLDAFCELFAVQFVMQPNPDAEARMKPRWSGRRLDQVRWHAKPLSSRQIETAKSLLAKRNGKRGARARMIKLTPEQRSRVARIAAQSRWARNADPSAAGAR